MAEIGKMPEALSLKAFAEFCESRPADEAYDYINPSRCPVAMFLRSNGYPSARVVPAAWRESAATSDYHDFDQRIEDAVNIEPCAFGALSTRLRAALTRSKSALEEEGR
jgi:hypothetical protein